MKNLIRFCKMQHLIARWSENAGCMAILINHKIKYSNNYTYMQYRCNNINGRGITNMTEKIIIRQVIFRPLSAEVQRAEFHYRDNYTTHKFTTGWNKSWRVSSRRPFAVHKLRINELPMFADRNGAGSCKRLPSELPLAQRASHCVYNSIALPDQKSLAG